MNDLFNQFASAFGKKEDNLSPADEFLAKKNKELAERKNREALTGKVEPIPNPSEEIKEFIKEGFSAIQPSKAFELTIEEAQQQVEEIIKSDFNIDEPDYSLMPQGLKEAQQRNGIRDHGLTGNFEKTEDGKVKFVESIKGTVYLNNPNEITPQIKSVIDRKFPDADYVGTGDKVLYRAGIDPYKADDTPSMAANIVDNKITINPKTTIPINNDEQADLFEKEPLIIDHLNLLEHEKPKGIIGKISSPKTTTKGKQKVPRTHDQETKTKAEFFGQFRSAIRKIWMFSAIRREAVKAAKKAPNKYLCANCKSLFKSTEIEVNHKRNCGSLREFEDFSPFISSMFQEDLTMLEVLCKTCHKKHTKENSQP